MPWFWSTKTDTKQDDCIEDIYSDIRPDLRDFARQQMATVDPIVPQEAGDHKAKDIAEFRILSKNRKAMINSAAMFNCAVAEAELSECFRSGSWWDKAKLCELQKGRFWGCLEGNKKFLQELGYGESSNTSEQDETILDRADELYLKQQSAELAQGKP